MTRVTIRRHLIQIKFARPGPVLPSERIHIPASEPIKAWHILAAFVALVTAPWWLAGMLWLVVTAGFYLIQAAAWLAGNAPWALWTILGAFLLFGFDCLLESESDYRYLKIRIRLSIEEIIRDWRERRNALKVKA